MIVNGKKVERGAIVKAKFGLIPFLLFGLVAALPAQVRAQVQSSSGQTTTATSKKAVPAKKKGRGAGREVASGSGDIGKGAAKGAGNLAVGTAKGAVDLVTLHPVDAAASVGKGAVSAGKDVGIGAVKGTGKIAIGTGKAIKHIF
jgi:hypothetical protein